MATTSSSTSPTRGLLFVTMQPKPSLSPALFHDWYNNEHGPNRTRLSSFIQNGFRYRATDLDSSSSSSQGQGTQSKPKYLAIYDVSDMTQFNDAPYQYLRAPPGKSQREIDVMAQIWVDRLLLDFVGEKVNEQTFVKLELPEHFDDNAKGNVLTTTRVLVPSADAISELTSPSALDQIAQLPGWRRTSWFKTSYLEPRQDGQIELVLINEFAPSPTVKDIHSEISSILQQQPSGITITRSYELFYTFGTAPRHLAIVQPWTSPDKLTKTIPAQSHPQGLSVSAIESYITTPDGAILPFRLEGNNITLSSDLDIDGTSIDTSPVLVLINSVLVTHGIWDRFLQSFWQRPEIQNRKFRVLRFLSRGRTLVSGDKNIPVTVDLLAKDVICLLDALRIPRAAGVVGVSMGGVTALATALKYPARVDRFIACDTSGKSPNGNKQTWEERVAVAEKEGKRGTLIAPWGSEGLPEREHPQDAGNESGTTQVHSLETQVVGDTLAELTVRRWFAESSFSESNLELVSEIARVKNMVATNSLPEFRRGVAALFGYDYMDLVKKYNKHDDRGVKKGAFLVGAKDGVLPKSMEALAGQLGSEAESNQDSKALFKVIQDAGHLPMVEKPEEVADFVVDFLHGKAT
ncbi:alpha/beta hydrolase, partial [Aureobasidium melanogenum]